MVQALRMPMMGNTMETGLLAEWVVDEGEPVEPDQVVAVVESEKAAADVVANQDGTLARVDVAEGEEVPPGTLVGVVLGPDENLSDAPPPRSRVEPGGSGGEGGGRTSERDREERARTEETKEMVGTEETEGTNGPGGTTPDTGDEPGDGRVRAAPGARRLAEEASVDLNAVEGTGPDGAVLIADVEERVDAARRERTSSRAFLSPSTRRLARELEVDLGTVTGTGAGGRVTESDVRAAAGVLDVDHGSRRGPTEGDVSSQASDVAGPPPRDPSQFGVNVTDERELAGVRRTVAERMSRSAREAPQVTLNREVSVERAFETVEELTRTESASDAEGAEVGFTDLLVGAAVRALERHPEFNAWYEGEALRLIEEVNVAVAVDAEAGLLTPVVRDASRRTLAGIARERRRLTDAVLEGRHRMDDLPGGTFTVSNLGLFGVDSFDPILDPPQVGILGVGRVIEGSCTLSLTFDHRVVDGADAARFLDTLVEGLESPSVVVAERSAAAGTGDETGDRSARGDEPASGPEGTTERVESAVAADLTGRAREIAGAHGWPVPAFEVRLDGDRPIVSVRAGRDTDTSPATLRRLTYAACRESRYAGTIAGLLDPDVELDRTDERD